MNKAYRHQIAWLTGIEPKEGDFSYLHAAYGDDVIANWKQYYSRALNGDRYSIIHESTDPETAIY